MLSQRRVDKRGKAILDGTYGHRKPERLRRAPAVGAEPAVECRAAAGAGEGAAGVCRSGVHLSSLRAGSIKDKIVIQRKQNHADGRA